MPTLLHPDELDRIARSPGWRRGRVEVIDTHLGKVVVKGQRPPRHPARYRLLNALARVLGNPFIKAAPMHGGAQAQAVEVARLRALRATGARVPEVLHVAPDHFVMQWLGDEHLGTLLQARHPCAGALWREGGRALVRVHASGGYLSQGFARNMIVDATATPPRLAGLIDFEDDPIEVMRLPEAQARDWLAYLHSTVWTLDLPLSEIDGCLDDWMAAEHAEVREQFLRACGQLAWLRHLPGSRRFGRDTMALQSASAAAHRYAARHAPAPIGTRKISD